MSTISRSTNLMDSSWSHMANVGRSHRGDLWVERELAVSRRTGQDQRQLVRQLTGEGRAYNDRWAQAGLFALNL